MKTTIPFQGFYNTIHDMAIDLAVDSEIDGGYLTEEASESINYSKLHRAYAQEYTKKLGQLLDVEFTFEELVSPKEYNFKNDVIIASMTPLTFKVLCFRVNRNNLAALIEQKFKPYDGFIPYYSNSLVDWAVESKDDLSDWSEVQVGTLIEAIVKDELPPDYDHHLVDDVLELLRGTY